jgi:signal transduction histidine kinase
MIRPTVRLRLTAWYASIFLLAGSALLAVSYVIVSDNTASFPDRVAQEMARRGFPRVVPIATLGPRGESAGSTPPGNDVRPPVPTPAYLEQVARVQAAAQKKVRAEMRREVTVDFGFALLATTLLSVAAGWVVAGRALRPVSRITATARRVAAGGDLSERIALAGPADELRELADTFDAMLARLDTVFASQRSFVANASHELRTPLAVMRAEIEERLDDPDAGEVELREMAAVVQEAILRSENLISGLLTLARSQSDRRPRETVDLVELARRATRQVADAARKRRLAIELPHGTAPVPGDGELLERLLTNLLENAVRYNHEGGFVWVDATPNGRAVTLEVVNSGPPVPAAAVPHLFEPFFRADDSRSRHTGGAGLGLAIVAAIAEAHRGSVSASRRADGGLLVSVTLPAYGSGAPVTTGQGSCSPAVTGRPLSVNQRRKYEKERS